MEEIDDILDKKHPRDYSWKRTVVYLIGASMGLMMFLIVFAALVSSCKPLVTSNHGYIIYMNENIIAVEHENVNRPGYGIVRYYPFQGNYSLGDSLNLKALGGHCKTHIGL